jgi:hypothetical protein
MRFFFFSVFYIFFAIATFGHLYRHRSGKPRPQDFLFAVIWPVWWLVSHGFGGTMKVVSDAVSFPFQNDDFSLAILLIWLFTAGYYLGGAWPACSGVVACSAVVAKAAAFMPLFALFWGWEIATWS